MPRTPLSEGAHSRRDQATVMLTHWPGHSVRGWTRDNLVVMVMTNALAPNQAGGRQAGGGAPLGGEPRKVGTRQAREDLEVACRR